MKANGETLVALLGGAASGYLLGFVVNGRLGSYADIMPDWYVHAGLLLYAGVAALSLTVLFLRRKCSTLQFCTAAELMVLGWLVPYAMEDFGVTRADLQGDLRNMLGIAVMAIPAMTLLWHEMQGPARPPILHYREHKPGE